MNYSMMELLKRNGNCLISHIGVDNALCYTSIAKYCDRCDYKNHVDLNAPVDVSEHLMQSFYPVAAMNEIRSNRNHFPDVKSLQTQMLNDLWCSVTICCLN